MARHRKRFRAWRSSVCALWAWLSLLGTAQAEPLHAGMRLAEPADRPLLARVRGQTGDLEVTLEALETAPLEVLFTAQLEAARALASEHGVRVLIWARRERGALELVVADFALDRVLVRPLAEASSALQVSAQEEAAALVARSALRASLAGSALGRPSEELAPEEPPPPPPAVVVPLPPGEPPPAPPRSTLRVGGELGWLSGLDGWSGHHALIARASLRWRGFELGLLGGVGVPVGIEERLARLRVATHRLEGSVGWAWQRGAWVLVPSLAAGLFVLRSAADARDAQLSAHDARLTTATLGAFVRAAYQPGRVGVSLRLGLDVLPRAPALGYETDAAFQRTERAWSAQPHAALALAF